MSGELVDAMAWAREMSAAFVCNMLLLCIFAEEEVPTGENTVHKIIPLRAYTADQCNEEFSFVEVQPTQSCAITDMIPEGECLVKRLFFPLHRAQQKLWTDFVTDLNSN